MNRLLIASLAALTLGACKKEAKQDNNILAEAGRYHAEATAMAEELKTPMAKVDSAQKALAARPDAASKAKAQSLDSLQKAFSDWQANLTDVPGLPSDKQPGDHHDDAAQAAPSDLSPEQIRDVQKGYLNSIRELRQRTQLAMEKADGKAK